MIRLPSHLHALRMDVAHSSYLTYRKWYFQSNRSTHDRLAPPDNAEAMLLVFVLVQ